jgi:hypothetical protein
MANNQFIDKLLKLLSLVNPRLRCPITKLHIQIEMQYYNVQSLINYFIMLQPEYKYNWKLYHNVNPKVEIFLTNISAFNELKDYMTREKLLTLDEAEWLEDALHETLIDDD